MIYLHNKELMKELKIHLKGLKLLKNSTREVELSFKDNMLKVTSVNKQEHRMTTLTSFEGTVEDINLFVNVEEFLNSLKLSNEVELTSTSMKIGRVTINSLPSMEYTFPALKEAKTYAIDFKAFNKAAKKVSIVLPDKDEVRDYMFNYFLNEGNVICSDGRRIGSASILEKGIDAVIPSSLGFMLPLLDKEGYIEADEYNLILKTDTVSIQKTLDNYTNPMLSVFYKVKDILAGIESSTHVVQTEELMLYIKHLNNFVGRTKNDKYSPVKLSFKDNKLTIQNPNLSTVFTLEVSSSTEATFSINGDYLYKTLSICKSKQITLTLTNVYLNVKDEQSNVNQTICAMRL